MPSPKSPFPGYDPYVQRFWRDVHARLVNYTAEAFHGKLPPGLRARIEERLIVEQPFHDADQRHIVPDLYVVEREHREPWSGGGSDGGVAMAEPMTFRILSEPLRETYLEIREPGTGGRVITVIEFLSPTNKARGEGMEKYLAKRQECREARVSVVEVDLIRGGHHVLALPESYVPERMLDWPRVCVGPGWNLEEIKFYPISLRTRMPAIAIPLRENEPPIPLDLQAVFDRCYEVGEYGLDIDYGADPVPHFSPEDAPWIDGMLREKGLRGG